MSEHASINRIFRLVWNEALGCWVAVAENARGRGKRSARAGVGLAALLASLGLWLPAHAAPPVPTQLPTGGNVAAGAATINPGVVPGSAVLNIDQSSQRAVINWNTFNLGSAAQVNFNQPNANSATLNRVLDSNPSQIFGKITATGQVFLSNPNGVLFGRGSSVDVGSLTATTLGITDANFMGNRLSFEGGASGSVVNEGELRAALGGYIALLAPEVRNQGVIVARMGAVALASGTAITLNFDGNNTLASLTVQPTALKALVENKGAVLAPGGLIILSAHALDRLQGGVVRNAGTLEASGLSVKNGRILLSGDDVEQTASGVINASGAAHGGSVSLSATHDLALQGSVSAASAEGQGGDVSLAASHRVTVRDASIDATGASGGGQVRVGGGFQGKDASIVNAQQTAVLGTSRIDASATQAGDGGQVVVWADEHTVFGGAIVARGGAVSGSGGSVEVSGKQHLDFLGTVNAGATHGKAGSLLLDPRDITVDAAGAAAVADVDLFATTPGVDSVISPNTITAITNTGTAVVLQANNDITVNSSIVTSNGGGNGGSLTFQAGRSITLNGSVTSDNADISFTANDAGADANRVAASDAVFTNNSLIDAGTGTVNITMGTKEQSGSISAGQVTAATLNITHNGPTAGAVTGQIDLGETTVSGDVTIAANSARNVTNALGSVLVRGTTTIGVGTGDVTITRGTTDFNIIGLTAGNVSLVDTNALRFATTSLSGSLAATVQGPIATTGAVGVGTTTNLTSTAGGFGYADPYLDFSNAGNHFAGAISLTLASNGTTGTGGYAIFRDAAAINFGTVNVNRTMTVDAVSGITMGTTNVGTSMVLTNSTSGAVALGTTTVGSNLTISNAGAISASGTTIVPGSTLLTAGSANNVTFNNAANNFYRVRVVSSNNASFVDTNAFEFDNGASNMAGTLAVTAGGSISQYGYNDNYSPITVGTTATFTVTGANSDLLLGPSEGAYVANYVGAANSIGGVVTLTKSGAGTFRDVQLSNVNSNAALLTGTGLDGGQRDMVLYYSTASSLTLPPTTLSGSLAVDVQSGGITQSGPLVVAGTSTFRAAGASNILLADAGNDFNRLTVRNAYDATIVDANAVDLYASQVYFTLQHNLNVAAGGAITDSSVGGNTGYYMNVGSGTASFTAGSANSVTLDNDQNRWNIVTVPSANNVTLNPQYNISLGNVNAAGTLTIDSRDRGALTQQTSTAVSAGGATTFTDFNQGITLSETGNVFGALAIGNTSGTIASVTLRENSPITQASAWSVANTTPIVLTTSNDQAITLDQANTFGNLTLTQVNSGAVGAAGAVHVRETGDTLYGMTQGSAWTLHGTTLLDSGATSINLNNANNVLGPLQVLGATGSTNSLPSTVTLYAKDTATTNAITDVGGTGAWATGTGVVKMIAYDTTGATAGGGNVILANTGNVMGDLYVKATNATITEADNITDGALISWNPAGDLGWVTTGATNLIVANPTSKSITLDNLNNVLGPLAVSTSGTPGTLTAVQIVDTTDLTQSAVWNVGTAPVTLNSSGNAINLSTSGNVLGPITIPVANGLPTSVAITEDDAITQTGAWSLLGVPVTLVAQNQKAITLTHASNIMGNLTLTGGAVSITENDNITQGSAWLTTGTTTLNAGANAITLANANNVLGDIAIGGAPSAVSITEDSDITQASAWVQAATPFTLNAGTHDIVLSQASNQLGDLRLTAQNATVTEDDAAGISDGNGWVIPGTTTLTAGAANPIVLNANPASNFGTVTIVSASDADITDLNGIVLGASTISAGGTFTVSAGGAITQSGAISAPSLRLIGTGSATLGNVANHVDNLAAGFSGGNLVFANAGDFAVAAVGGTSGITIGAHDVTLSSASGTITGLSTVNAGSTSLTVTTGTALSLPQMSIAGPQTYTATGGITLTAGVAGTASGAINFMSPVTLGADLSVQSSNSAINFNGSVTGATNQLTVNAGSAAVHFYGAVSDLGDTGDAGAALQLTAVSGTIFDSTLGANNGLAITGPVVFTDTVTLADGNAASVFTGLVTLGKAGGMNLSGYDGMTFNNGVLLQNGAATIDSNNSALSFQTAGTVSGPYALTLNSGTQALIGIDRMGSNLTGLTVIALNPTIPSGGVTIAGAQSYTATNSSAITLSGNVTSTATGAIDFHSPVTVGAAATVSSTNSAITFDSTLDGNRNLTVSSGSGLKTFTGAVGAGTTLGSGTGAALVLQGTGASTFSDTVEARSGITAAGAVAFTHDVTLGNGDTGSAFTGLVTSGGSTGNTLSGYDGMAFNGGLTLSGGAVSVASNGSTLSFGGAVSGAHNLTLNALAGGAGTVSGLNQIGSASNLTSLDVTAQTLSLPATGLAVAGPMSFTAAGGITLNGAVGSDSAPATTQIDFNSPVLLATGGATVTSHNAAVNFASTINGAQALTVNAGSGTTTFGAAIGGITPLTSLATDAGGTTALNGGSVATTGAQTYNDSVTLGAASTLTGTNVGFAGTLDGAQTLTVNASGTTTFGGIVGGNAPLTSISTNAAGSTAINTSAVTTTGAQTYNDALTLGATSTLSGAGLSFNGTLNGAFGLTANAGTSALQFNGAVGGGSALSSLTGSGNTIALAAVTTSGTQDYTAVSGITLGGNLATTNSTVTLTGPVALGADLSVSTNTGAGSIVLSGPTSTINGAHGLTLSAGSGNVVLGGAVGGITPLTAMTVSGYDLTLPGISTVGDANQSYAALNNITLNQSRTLSAPVSFTADSDSSGSGSFVLLNGVSLTASNNTLAIQAADIDLQGSSTLSSGSGATTITASGARNISLGGADAAGQLTISGSELSRISSSGGLSLRTTGTGWEHVENISAAESQNITGTLSLLAQGTGNVDFITTPSTFNAITANATGGTINVGVNLTTTGDAITFATPVAVAGASTINSAGGNISFSNTLAVDNDLTLTTSNGVLTLGGAVGSNRTLTVNLGGGSVTGLNQLQSALTGLTVNSSSGISLPALAISGPQVYNTGVITATGNLSGVGIAFNNVLSVVPGSGSALSMNAGTGTLAFNELVSFNANNMTLTGDEVNFTKAVTGSGSLLLQPSTNSRNLAVGGSGSPISGLNLTAAEMAWLPIGTLASLTLGRAAGTGTLDVAGALSEPGIPLTLNGGGGITQSGGAITSGALTLYAAGNGITLANPANAVGAVAINGTPTSLNLANSLAISQQGSAAWALGTGNVTLNAGSHDISLNNAGNTFGTLALTGGEVQVTEAAATDIGVSSISKSLTVASSGAVSVSGALAATGNVGITSTGTVTQSAALTIGGNLGVVTTVAAGDVTINNTGANGTTIGDTLVGGAYVLTATGDPITQAAGASLQVRGNFTATGSTIVLAGAGNLIGGTTTLPATSTVELRQAGVITLGNRTDTGNLTVISQRTNRSFGSGLVGGTAVVLNNAANNITGSISVSASAPTITLGADLATGINQTAGTAISVAGVASFTAEASGLGSSGVNLSNAGNNFGTLQVSGTTVDVHNSAVGLTTIGNALAATSMILTTAGAIAQTGTVIAPTLDITAAGAVTLSNVANDVGTLAVVSSGNAINYADANGFAVAGINAGGANVGLTAGGAGNLTQSAALLNVGTLTANAGGAVTINHTGNTIGSLAASTAGTGFQLRDASGGLTVAGAVHTTTGDMLVRSVGDITLNASSGLHADAGDLAVSTEGAGNFINNGGASALTAGAGHRWLVYSDTPDLVGSVHTVKGGLVSAFRHYGASYATYPTGSVTESGNGFIYNDASPTLTVGSAVTGTPSHVYGSAPTGALSYVISAGLVDSEDNSGNVISGGTATYSAALANTMNAGSYDITYTGGLTSAYTLLADTNGVAYTVTPAVLTYTADAASRAYGAANPAVSGVLSGFQLGQNASVLAGSEQWNTTAVPASNAGSYAITGSGYTASNYTFAQAAGNATAFTVAQANLTVTANNDAKTYDGNAYSGGAGVSYSAFANGESAGVLAGSLVYGGSAQGARNAGSYAITPTGLSSGNYNITFADGTLAVGRANLTLAASNVSKSYDGSLAATGTAVATAGTATLGTDTLSGGSFAFTDANAGAGNKTVNLSAVSVNDGNSGNNYNIGYASNTTSTITPASLTVSSSNVTKTYDNTLTAAGSATVVAGTLFSNASNGGVQDSLSGGSFAFSNANAGAGNRTVTASGVTVVDGNGGGNYTLTHADNTTSTINRANLIFTGTASDKVYDGTNLATQTGYALTGFIGTQTVGATTATSTFDDKDAAVGKTVTFGGIALADLTSGSNGGLASNYSVGATATTTATITPKVLTVNAVVDNKVYDGGTAATMQSYGLSGFAGTETVTGNFTGSANFIDKNVGNGKSVTITGINLLNGTNGGLASNYVAATGASSNANITPAPLNVAGVVSVDKVYDGTLAAYMNTSASVLAGAIGSDDVQVGSITGAFLTKDVGVNKAIVGGSFSLTGSDAGNYALIQPPGLTANVTPRSLVVSAIGSNKVYDTTTAATVTLADNRIGGDSLAVTSSAAFLDKNAGTGKYVAVTGIALSGTDALNYSANTTAAAFADIAKAPLTVGVVAASKVYDTTQTATVSISNNHLGSDVVSVAYGSASFDNKNAATGKTVTVSGINVSGADAGNYSVATTATTTADVTPATLTVSAAAQAKVYDGTTAATVTLSDNRLGSDGVTVTYIAAAFNDKNAGPAKTVTVSGVAINGTDAGNYTTGTSTTTTASITPATLVAGATGISKLYDGTTLAAATLSDNRINGDDISLTAGAAAFGNAAIGNGKAISVTGIQIAGGADQANYVLASNSVTTFADITGYADTWSLRPVMPTQLIPSAPTAPPSLLDLGLAPRTEDKRKPTVVAAVKADPELSGSGDPAAPAGAPAMSVSLAREAALGHRGLVWVSVARDMISSSNGFSFRLPAEIAELVGNDKVSVTLGEDKPLPAWLRYMPAAKTFVFKNAPIGALPVRLTVRLGDQRWTVMITEFVGK